MKKLTLIITFIILSFFSSLLLGAENDSLSYYVTNNMDTIYVNKRSDITNCNYLVSLEKSHNKCEVVINDTLYSGKIYYHIVNTDSTVQVFDGIIADGLIQDGITLRYSKSGKLILSGQYSNNWKYGIWTSYYSTGEIEAVMKFIKYTDDPVVEWEYDKKGQLVYHNNEQNEIEEKIKNHRLQKLYKH
jgi:hypothetical protein